MNDLRNDLQTAMGFACLIVFVLCIACYAAGHAVGRYHGYVDGYRNAAAANSLSEESPR